MGKLVPADFLALLLLSLLASILSCIRVAVAANACIALSRVLEDERISQTSSTF